MPLHVIVCQRQRTKMLTEAIRGIVLCSVPDEEESRNLLRKSASAATASGVKACAPAVGTTMPRASRSMQLFSTSALFGPSSPSQVVSLHAQHHSLRA